MTTRRFLAAIFLVLLFTSNSHAWANDKREDIVKQAELNMLLSGTIDVSPDGSVVRYRIDQADKLTPVVTASLLPSISAAKALSSTGSSKGPRRAADGSRAASDASIVSGCCGSPLSSDRMIF